MVWFSQYSYQFLFAAYLHVSELPISSMGGDANIAVFVRTSQRVSLWLWITWVLGFWNVVRC